jgi:DNA-binding HxlR family transcriptional regulator
MSRPSGSRRSTCPIDYALEIFGDRWTLLVVRDLLFSGKRHFREFLESPEGIASNVLSERLRRLEAWGLVSRREDPDNRRQVVYSLTDKALDLTPALLEIIRWSGKHDPDTGAPAAFLRRIEKDREGLAAEIRARARSEREPGAPPQGRRGRRDAG